MNLFLINFKIKLPPNDIFDLAYTFNSIFNKFLLQNKEPLSPEIKFEAISWKKYFLDIVEKKSHEKRPTSEEIVNHLQKRMYEFSDQNPGEEWKK